MIHYVIREVDQGAPIVTKELALHEGETLDQVEARMHKLGQYLLVLLEVQLMNSRRMASNCRRHKDCH